MHGPLGGKRMVNRLNKPMMMDTMTPHGMLGMKKSNGMMTSGFTTAMEGLNKRPPALDGMTPTGRAVVLQLPRADACSSDEDFGAPHDVTTPRAKAFAPTARARKAGHSDIELIEDDTYDEEITALEEASPLPSVHDEDKGVKFGDEADLDEFEDALDGEDLFDTHGVLFCDSLQWLDAREYEFDYELASEDDGVSGYEDTFEYVSGGLDDFHTGGHAFLTEDTPGNLEYSDDTLLYKDEGGGKTPRERAKEGLRRRRRMNQTSYKKFQQQLFTLSHVFLACTAAVGALAHEIIAEPATDLWRVFQPTALPPAGPGGEGHPSPGIDNECIDVSRRTWAPGLGSLSFITRTSWKELAK
ncbi:unnamed protein product [Durusdinium trenchii]|uniref:Uncharacterized protein n=1 Tax=Durusdinium trenchii TaxID=1381693 RepID=A0ABP0K6F0_9DINO